MNMSLGMIIIGIYVLYKVLYHIAGKLNERKTKLNIESI